MTRTLLHASRFLLSASIAIALTACATNSQSSVPAAAAASQAGVVPQTVQNDSGEYSGTVQDSALGTGSASASLAQDKHVVGGVVNVTYGSSTFSYAFAANTRDGLSLAGVQTASLVSGVCSYGVSATYDTTKHVLTGTYQAANGCAGGTGSFSLTEGCSYRRGGLLEIVSGENRNVGTSPDSGLHPC